MSDDVDKESWIRRRAYQLWQEGGEAHGQHEDHWHRAEREYDESRNAPSGGADPGDLEEDLIEPPPPAGETAADRSEPSRSAPVDPSAAQRDAPAEARDPPSPVSNRRAL